MKLNELNDDDIEDQLIQSADKYNIAKTKGNITRKQATDDPDKTTPDDSIPQQPDRSGNQQTAASSSQRVRKFVGATGGSRGKIKPKGEE
jgi:hypothetical protein